MYYSKETIIEKLKLTNEEFELYRTLKMLPYSVKTNKYDMEKLLIKRTMSIGIDRFLTENQKEILKTKMENYSSYKRILTKKITNGEKFSNSGLNREHRKIGEKYKLTSLESDGCLKSVEGVIKSAKTLNEKHIRELENKIEDLELEYLEDKEKNSNGKDFHKNYFRGKKKKISYLKHKLETCIKNVDEENIKIFYGKNIYKKMEICRKELYLETNLKKRNKLLHEIKRLKQEYQEKRLEYYVEGSINEGNKKISIEEENGEYILRLVFGSKKIDQIKFPIKIPSSNLDTFKLTGTNKQSNKIIYNKKGKLVLNSTYSYIKPLSREYQNCKKSKGTIGIDIGPNEISCVFVKNDGNREKKINYNIGEIIDSRNEEKQRRISEILEEIIKIGKELGYYHVSYENLSFNNTKYVKRSRELNRLLKKFPYRIFEELLISKLIRTGFKYKKINPRYTSYIGLRKYSYRDDLTSNHNKSSKDFTRAYVIGRRGLGFKEKVIVCIRLFDAKDKVKKTLSFKPNSILNELEEDLSKVNVCKSNWSVWNLLKKNDSKISEYFNSLTGSYS